MSENTSRDEDGESHPTTIMERQRNDDDQKKKREKAKEKIQESRLLLQFNERLSYLDANAGRLEIKNGQQLLGVLTEAETEMVEGSSLKVVTTDPRREYQLDLFRMNRGNKEMILDSKWGQLVAANGWEEGDTVECCWYRHGDHHQLCLKLHGLVPPLTPLFEKILHHSDVSVLQGRLLIPKAEALKLMEFLTPEERRKVESSKDYVRVVTTTDRDGDVEYALHLKKWPAKGSVVLTTAWVKLIRANGLRKDDSVKVHGYRQDGESRLKIFIIKKSY